MSKRVLVCIVCCLVYQYSLLSVNQAVILKDLGSNSAEASNLGLLPLIQSIDIPLPDCDCSTEFKRKDGAFIGEVLYPSGYVCKHQTIDYRFMLPVLKLVYARIKTTNAAHANTISEIKKLQTALTANQTSIAASNKQNAAQLKALEERLDQFVGQLQFGQLQTAFNTFNQQSTAQLRGLEQQVRRLEEQVDHLVLCNTRLMEFLSWEYGIVSTQTDDFMVETGSGQSEKL